jgi:probable phosphomutase (TIGR03848 family)
MATTTGTKKSAAPKRAAKQAATKTAPRTKAAPKKRAAAQGPKPTTILMVRHGQTPTTGKVLPGRAKGLHLADLGHEQAKIAALRLAELKIDAVYSSPLERAKETAAPISAACGLKTQIERGLFECDFGDWTGKELKDLMKLPEWQTVQRAPSTFRFPNGESFTEMQTRMVGALDKLRKLHPGGTIVCVSHADTIKAAVAHAMGTHIDLFQRIVISPASISAVTWHAGGPIVLAVNSTGRPLTELKPA